MRTIDIFDNYYTPDRIYERIRYAVRAVIIDNGRIYIERASKGPIIMLPGGGVELGESKEECVIRECAEECGLVVRPVKQLFVINERYQDILFNTTYVLCEIIGKCQSSPTPGEAQLSIRGYYQDIRSLLNDLKEILNSIEDKESELYGMNYREYLAINEILNIVQNSK